MLGVEMLGVKKDVGWGEEPDVGKVERSSAGGVSVPISKIGGAVN